MAKDCCEHKKKKDWLLWGSFSIIILAYIGVFLLGSQIETMRQLGIFAHSVVELMNKMFWGLALGIVFVGILGKLPRTFLTAVLGKGGTFSGILRATAGGVLLDLCSHGVLLVGMQLYKKGASLGQTFAFLIASPWNSLSLTLVLWALIGLKWTLFFLIISMIIGIISGTFVDWLVKRGVLPANPNQVTETVSLKEEWQKVKRSITFNPVAGVQILKEGLLGARMILKWIFFGTILAALIRAFINPETFSTWFGPTLGGLALTILIATIFEVCSEGSTPIAADLVTRAGAPGNAFAFLMTGVATDYTEILSIKETTRSWKVAFFLPLITLPQVIAVAWVINAMLI